MRARDARAILLAMDAHSVLAAVARLPRRATLAVLALALVACGQSARVASTASAAVEDVVVAVDRSIAVQRFDGARRVLVTLEEAGGYPLAPRWVPDGRSIAYVQRRFFTGTAEADWGDDLMLQPVDGTPGRTLRVHRQRGQTIEGLAWTPDGRALLLGDVRMGANGNPFAAGASRLVRFDLASSTERVLVEDATDPSLSADGRRLAFVRGAQAKPALLVADGDGAQAVEVVPAGVFVVIRSPRVAPDGRSILFAAPAEGAMGATPPPAPAPLMRPSLLARLLAPRRAEAHGLPSYVWAVDIASGQRRRLSEFAMDDPAVAWADGGRAVVFLATDGLYRALPDGSATQRADGGALGAIDAR
jgi:Tol biopolymer transport system component